MRRAARLLVFGAAASVAGCASAESERGAPRRDASAPEALDERPPFDASVYGDGAPVFDPSRVSLRQEVWGIETSGDGAVATDDAGVERTTPLEGARVCWDGGDVPCATTGADGWFELRGLPKYANVVLTVDRAGYVPVTEPLVTSDLPMTSNDLSVLRMLPVTAWDALVAPDVVLDPDRGSIAFTAAGSLDGTLVLLSGVTVSLNASHDGPTYLDRWEPVPDAGASLGHLGLLWNVPPETHRLSFEHPELACEPGGRGEVDAARPAVWGFPTERPDVVGVPVLPGRTTQLISVYCFVPRADADAAAAGQ